jgi:hypothetical protein
VEVVYGTSEVVKDVEVVVTYGPEEELEET